MKYAAGLVCLMSLTAVGAVRDVAFKQEAAVRIEVAPELRDAVFQRLAIHHDGMVYALTDKGVARLLDQRLALDRSFRPLTGKVARDLAVQRGHLFYLFDDGFLSNDWAGKSSGRTPPGSYRRMAVGDDGIALLSSPTNLALFREGRLTAVLPLTIPRDKEQLFAWGSQFYVLAADHIYRVAGTRIDLFHRGQQLTALGLWGHHMWVGSSNGLYRLDLQTGRVNLPLQTNLPVPEITCLAPTAEGVWAGTPRGAFFRMNTGGFRYYASKRWLADDEVVDVQVAQGGDVLVLSRTGLSRLEFRPMTLAQKAAYYDRKIRQRHMRYGFCSELRLGTPGDPASAEMIDTDNDGSWSSYYLASQAFRYAVTGAEEARANAWETFEALERLQTIHGRSGFPARTFERRGFKFSDPERWHPAPDPSWEWKAHTSSDEITAHTFGYAVLYETTARTPAEKMRIATAYDQIMTHILEHDLYLVDVDGQPTLWGRWNPEYVNHYPPSIVDRRLNSAEIIAFLQFAYRLTAKEAYRHKAFELMERHHYLENLTNTMAGIAFTPGYVFRGNDMGDEWNHSDDLLAFVNYWTLHRYAFTEDLRRLYAAAMRDHWEIEKVERCPLWNFVLAITGTSQYDAEGAVWTLQHFPLDLVSWRMTNSHRRDVTRLPDNFRRRQSEQLLPPAERAISRWNGNPFTLDGGDGGGSELAGDEYLLPYWMGRYLRIIQ